MTDPFSRSGASPPKTIEPTYEGDFVLDGSCRSSAAMP